MGVARVAQQNRAWGEEEEEAFLQVSYLRRRIRCAGVIAFWTEAGRPAGGVKWVVRWPGHKEEEAVGQGGGGGQGGERGGLDRKDKLQGHCLERTILDDVISYRISVFCFEFVHSHKYSLHTWQLNQLYV